MSSSEAFFGTPSTSYGLRAAITDLLDEVLGIVRRDRECDAADLGQDNPCSVGDVRAHGAALGAIPAEVAIAASVTRDPPAESAAMRVRERPDESPRGCRPAHDRQRVV